MKVGQIWYLVCVLAPIVLMLTSAQWVRFNGSSTARIGRTFQIFSWVSLGFASLSLGMTGKTPLWIGLIATTPLSAMLALLVQLLGTVIGSFSTRYLQGEINQHRYFAALAMVLASVQLLLIADHWLILITAWAMVGKAMQYLLCFYADRPFALLAAHKKRIADRIADVLLVVAAALAWRDVGSGELSAIAPHIAQQGLSASLQISALLLVLAVVLRTAVLPVHGWLIQVMEAPTPVSALLHAGVVNLGGFVLIRLAPLLDQAMPARVLLLVLGLATAVMAGMVMLTRVSIKVRLAWSTVAQMGFMLLECALGLYTLAALHLIGHSLYKAHAFLSASSIVRTTRLNALHAPEPPTRISLLLAPVLAVTFVGLLTLASHQPWPWWWSVVLGVAWAPLLWLPSNPANAFAFSAQAFMGFTALVSLTIAALAAHALPFGIHDAPHDVLGLVALMGLTAIYVWQAFLQRAPRLLSQWHRWSYAGFYLDEAYTRLALKIWPARWSPPAAKPTEPSLATALPS